MKGKILVRADASTRVGTGHVFRCLALLEKIPDRKQVLFVCGDSPGNLASLVQEQGYSFQFINDLASEMQDATETIGIIRQNGSPELIIVDHYGLGSEWEKRVRPFAQKLLAIDDLADRSHDVDILVDSTHTREEATIYDDLLPRAAVRLIGQDYVMLRSEFRDTPPLVREYFGVDRLLITLGGSDPHRSNLLVLDALDSAEFAHISIDLTVGLSNVWRHEIETKVKEMENVSIHLQHHKISQLMRASDLCVGAGGTTSWERCYMGLPTLAMELASNQAGMIQGLESIGAVRGIGLAQNLTVEKLRASLRWAISDIEWREKASVVGRKLVDGKGVDRIMRHLNVH